VCGSVYTTPTAFCVLSFLNSHSTTKDDSEVVFNMFTGVCSHSALEYVCDLLKGHHTSQVTVKSLSLLPSTLILEEGLQSPTTECDVSCGILLMLSISLGLEWFCHERVVRGACDFWFSFS
jgi:hypothetical protein